MSPPSARPLGSPGGVLRIRTFLRQALVSIAPPLPPLPLPFLGNLP